jgi:hypothetical protein
MKPRKGFTLAEQEITGRTRILRPGSRVNPQSGQKSKYTSLLLRDKDKKISKPLYKGDTMKLK